MANASSQASSIHEAELAVMEPHSVKVVGQITPLQNAGEYHIIKSKKEAIFPNDFFKQANTMTNLILNSPTI